MPEELRASRNGTRQDHAYDAVAARIAEAARDTRVTRIVDVGAGDFELTRALARLFPAAAIEAWDLFADKPDVTVPHDLPSRVRARRVDLNHLDGFEHDGTRFDVVACFAVIEHVLDPAGLLRFLRSLAAPGGLVYVAGPEVTSAAHRLLGRRWPYYCPDDHLTLPSLRSMECALRGAGGRYELRRMNVHYSLKYLLRYLNLPAPVPRALDFLLPLPTGAFELVWRIGS
jgi:SAM-dependent methyltransferase